MGFRLSPWLSAALLLPVARFSFGLPAAAGEDEAGEAAGWTELFNGKDLDGWTPKVTGYPCGENALDTFRVEDGIIKVSRDK